MHSNKYKHAWYWFRKHIFVYYYNFRNFRESKNARLLRVNYIHKNNIRNAHHALSVCKNINIFDFQTNFGITVRTASETK